MTKRRAISRRYAAGTTRRNRPGAVWLRWPASLVNCRAGVSRWAWVGRWAGVTSGSGQPVEAASARWAPVLSW
jgi:hypothetical protein